MSTNSIKDNYSFVLGFLAIVFSLGAFKDELKIINIDIGILQFTLLNYFFVVLCLFIVSLYLMALDNIVSITPLANNKILSKIAPLAYFLFVFSIISPIILVIAIILNKFILLLNSINFNIEANVISSIVGSITSFVSILISIITSKVYLNYKKNTEKQSIELIQDTYLETSQKLYDDGDYTQSIISASKALEAHITTILVSRDIRVENMPLIEKASLLEKHNLFSSTDIDLIKHLRRTRSRAIHTDDDFTKEQAKDYLQGVRSIISKAEVKAC